jgi:ATP-binding cassette subfamily F protein uup
LSRPNLPPQRCPALDLKFTPSMILLNAHKIEFSLPGRSLLNDVDLTLSKGEKVGLVGRNGTGKSTLLRILSEELRPDAGQITLRSGTRLRYLDQLPHLCDSPDTSLRQVVCQGSPELNTMRRRYEELCEELEKTPARQDELSTELNRLTDQLTLHDAWDLETRADTLLTTVGFADSSQTLRGLSGGEQKRVALARTLLVPPDVLLLDEPTNHLDIATIAWLEDFLKNAKFTVLMVTHDRFFLERVCRRIVEVADQTLHSYSGNYSQYLDLKAQREAQKVRQQERFDNILRQEEAWLKQGPKARSTKQKARMQRVHAMLDMGSGVIQESGQTEDQAWDLGTRRLGKKVIDLEIESHMILKPFSFRLEPGERVGLVGANGSGKTTFLNLLAGNTTLENGLLEIGETVKSGYFDQHTDRLAHLDPETRVLDALKDVAAFVPLKNGKELTAARLLELFLFTGSQHATPLKRLSGGERKRLELLRILMTRPNLLLADEPTNDLDIETLSRLEFFLDGFPGCVCVASHDRFLLQRLCDRILIFRDGYVEESTPAVLDEVDAGFFDLETSVEPAKETKKVTPVATPSKKKLTYKEQSELSQLEKSIPEWEEKLRTLDLQLAEVAGNYAKVKELFQEKQAMEKLLEEGVEKWAELEELKESFQN